MRKDGEKWTLILVRELRHSPEKVWQALTDPAHLREVGSFDADGSLGTVGATVKLTTVAAPKPPRYRNQSERKPFARVLEYNWVITTCGGTRSLWWRHAPDVVDQHRPALYRPWCRRVAHCFDVLDRLLSGTPIGRMVGLRR